MGRVLNIKGEPVRGAKLEVWQANAHGRYTHPADMNTAPLDANFEGFALLKTDAEGRYKFKTIKPGAYPTGSNTMRPPHIHFRLSGHDDVAVGTAPPAPLARCRIGAPGSLPPAP